MIKIGTTGANVLVELTRTEFRGLARQNAADVPDDTDISLKWVKDAIDLVDGNTQQLATVKAECVDLIQAIDGVA